MWGCGWLLSINHKAHPNPMAVSESSAGVVVCVVVLSLSAWVACEQCKPNIFSPCKAECNGTTFDLSAAFNFPMVIDAPQYQYTWSPCDGFNCTNSGLDCAVCQKTNQYFNISCGKMSNPVWIWEVGETPDKFPNWRIEYTFGDSWRISFFEFVLDSTVLEPVIQHLGESPSLQYNFRVTGKCLGQPTPECKKIYEKNRQRVATS